MNCKYSKLNQFKKLICELITQENEQKGESDKKLSPICPYQRYCGKTMEWENTNMIQYC